MMIYLDYNFLHLSLRFVYLDLSFKIDIAICFLKQAFHLISKHFYVSHTPLL